MQTFNKSTLFLVGIFNLFSTGSLHYEFLHEHVKIKSKVQIEDKLVLVLGASLCGIFSSSFSTLQAIFSVCVDSLYEFA